MILTALLFILGIALTVFGADLLVNGATGIAKKYHVSEFVIGVVIVGIGTSMPELTVSLFGALKGSSGIAIGNVSGSNLFNTLLILGITALISPIDYTRSNVRRDMPYNIAASLLLLFFAVNFWVGSGNQTISWIEGLIFLACFVGYVVETFKNGEPEEEDTESPAVKSVWLLALMVLAGIGMLVLGGKLFVDEGCVIARELGVSETVIAITLMACGTSLPELATCVVAAAKHRNQLALGNILGSNVFNILLILSCCSLVRPLDVDPLCLFSLYALPVVALVLLLTAFVFKRNRLCRAEGIFFLLLYVAYVFYTVAA